MIVDCHTHIKYPSSDVDIAEHLDACEKIDSCVVLAPRSTDGDKVNRTVSEYARQYEKIVGFAAINPLTEKIATKNVKSNIADMGLRGVVLYCARDKFHPADSRAMRFYDALEQLNLPVFFHNSAPFESDAALEYAQPYLLDEIARTFPALKIVIGTMGLPFIAQTLCMLNKHQNVYADLTISPQKVWQVYNIVISAHEAEVMDRLLFGSGYPFAKADNCIETLLGFNKMFSDTHLPQVPREKIRAIVERDSLGVLGIQ